VTVKASGATTRSHESIEYFVPGRIGGSTVRFYHAAGGCDWQQIDIRRRSGQGTVDRIRISARARVELDASGLVETAPAEFGYRSRTRFKTGAGGCVGFHEAAANSIVEIDASASAGLKRVRERYPNSAGAVRPGARIQFNTEHAPKSDRINCPLSRPAPDIRSVAVHRRSVVKIGTVPAADSTPARSIRSIVRSAYRAAPP